jgi:hypothetical protein
VTTGTKAEVSKKRRSQLSRSLMTLHAAGLAKLVDERRGIEEHWAFGGLNQHTILLHQRGFPPGGPKKNPVALGNQLDQRVSRKLKLPAQRLRNNNPSSPVDGGNYW